jgi:hypothetical protein
MQLLTQKKLYVKIAQHTCVVMYFFSIVVNSKLSVTNKFTLYLHCSIQMEEIRAETMFEKNLRERILGVAL